MSNKVLRGKKAIPRCSVEGCQHEPVYHLGRGGWRTIYTEGPFKTDFLCEEHRESWFDFHRKYSALYDKGSQPGEDGWPEEAEKNWNIFLKWVKGERFEVCPFCNRTF
ncbi:unnamed protein product [marine sediment metagenome]|uniref:Uncharacterized protein n=1 Tax=marine sediment metagenome TaxID=412755 RepID=X1SBQ3_9ZZZZ